jgi:MSHA biogenesis protein MshQ
MRATYFNNKSFSGSQVTRIDPNVDFDWSDSSPDSAVIARDTFSARWIGKFQANVDGAHQFSITTDGGVRLTVNGQVIIDQLSVSNALHTVNGSIDLAAGQKAPIVLEYVHDTSSNVQVQLRYSANGRR